MATIAEYLTSLANTKTAIKEAIVAKGVAVADTDTFASYATKIGEIQSGGGGEVVDKTKFGMSIDNLLGDVDADGTYVTSTEPFVLDFSGVKKIGTPGLQYTFYSLKTITRVAFSSLQSVGGNGMRYAFYNCSSITSLDLSSLSTIGSYGMSNVFNGCTGLVSVDLSSLQSVENYGLGAAFNGCTGLVSVDLSSLQSVGYMGLETIFRDCTGLVSVDLSSLQSVGGNGMYGAFRDCGKLTAMSFPSLTSVEISSFGTSTTAYVFRGCSALTEIHFRADMQATIEAMTGYADKWGATNASIIFDL